MKYLILMMLLVGCTDVRTPKQKGEDLAAGGFLKEICLNGVVYYMYIQGSYAFFPKLNKDSKVVTCE